jgi:hypothetical protein
MAVPRKVVWAAELTVEPVVHPPQQPDPAINIAFLTIISTT